MKTLILGPTRTRVLDEPTDIVRARLASWADSGLCPYAATHRGVHFQFAIRESDRHRWSPHLTIEVRDLDIEDRDEWSGAGDDEAREGDRTEVFGRFNPSPGIWTGYMLATLSLVTIILGALTWACAELVLGDPPRALWVVPACVVVLVVMWAISAVGQRLAGEEMAAMWQDIESTLQEQ